MLFSLSFWKFFSSCIKSRKIQKYEINKDIMKMICILYQMSEFFFLFYTIIISWLQCCNEFSFFFFFYIFFNCVSSRPSVNWWLKCKKMRKLIKNYVHSFVENYQVEHGFLGSNCLNINNNHNTERKSNCKMHVRIRKKAWKR